MLFLILATLTTDIILLRIYKAMGWDEAVSNWVSSHTKPFVAIIFVLALTVVVNLTIRYGMDLLNVSDAAKPIVLGVGLGLCLSLIPLTQPKSQ